MASALSSSSSSVSSSSVHDDDDGDVYVPLKFRRVERVGKQLSSKPEPAPVARVVSSKTLVDVNIELRKQNPSILFLFLSSFFILLWISFVFFFQIFWKKMKLRKWPNWKNTCFRISTMIVLLWLLHKNMQRGLCT